MVTLLPMDEIYYENVYKSYCINELKKQCIENGYWTEAEADDKALNEQNEVLNYGKKTSGNYIFCVYDENDKNIVGEIWIGELEKGNSEIGFIYDLHIDEKKQNKGYGKNALYELEKNIKAIGFKKIRLHVFSINTKAMELYKIAGFIEFDRKGNSIWMEKEINN